jgi:phage/plasmid-like protein (TIGR03299 family)
MSRYLQAETKIDGSRAMFTSGRKPSFTTLGTETKTARTAEEALKEAQLDWQVFKSENPVQTIVPGAYMSGDKEQAITFKDKFMTYRFNPITSKPEALGVVGSRYTPVQNLEAFSLLNNIADDSGAVFDSAGSLDGGKKVFMTMKLPEGIQVGGVDKVDMYLLAWNAHDGSSSFSIHVTPIRLWCQNQIRMIMRTAESSYTLRHTPKVNGKVIAAREALGLTFKYVEEFERSAELLLGQKYSDKEFYRLVETLIPIDEENERARNVAEEARQNLVGLWKAPTQENILNTKWAAYNAVAEYADWTKPVRGTNVDSARAVKTITGLADRFKNKALTLLS